MYERRLAQGFGKKATTPRRKKLQIVGLLWTDAVFSDKEEAPKPMAMFTVGFMVEETSEHVAVAHEVDEEGGFRGTTTVPRGMVKRIVKFGKPIPVNYEA